MKRVTPPRAPRATEPKDQLIPGHHYDGIKEYDNPMPGWWVKTFYACIAFALVYGVALHFTGTVDSYADDLAQETAALDAMRAAYAAGHPAFSTDPATLAAFVANRENAAAGAVLFANTCASCHGDRGQGLIGPNLADHHWLHGKEADEIYEVLAEGVLDKGMPGWKTALSDEDRGKLVAYVLSLEGTNPSGAKAPQGVKVEG